MLLVEADTIPPQPWKNGGGSTRELFTWPSADRWQLRISLADIEREGPFSAYPGVERWFAAVDGAGVLLRFGDQEQRVTPSSEPISFRGDDAPGCSLVSGPTRDLNLMVRDGKASMERARLGAPWSARTAQCGLFTMKSGVWACGGLLVDVPPRSLLWMESAPTEAQLFEADSFASPLAWWMSFDAET